MHFSSKVLLPAFAGLAHVSGQGFAESCVNYNLVSQEESIFYANCYTVTGSLQYTEIDLNLCLGNSNGYLVVRALLFLLLPILLK